MIYCNNCGEDNLKNIAFLNSFADSDEWKCKKCGETFQTNKDEE